MLKSPWIYGLVSLALGLYMLFAFPNLTWLPWLFVGIGVFGLAVALFRIRR